jgi:TatD DNase family protein
VFDIGVNLTNNAFRDDRDAVVSRAVAAGVNGMAITGTNLQASREAITLTQRYSVISSCTFCSTAGVHPHDAKDLSEGWLGELESLANEPTVAAIGETGLDFNRNYSPREAQLDAFHAQLDVASRAGLPVFVHDRDSAGEVARVLAQYQPRLRDVVVHCFTGTADELSIYLDAGYSIGITGWVCDERRGGELARLVADIPADALMLETDAPFLLPRSISPRPKSRRNEPANLRWVVERVAALRGEEPGIVARQTQANAERFFCFPAGLPEGSPEHTTGQVGDPAPARPSIPSNQSST